MKKLSSVLFLSLTVFILFAIQVLAQTPAPSITPAFATPPSTLLDLIHHHIATVATILLVVSEVVAQFVGDFKNKELSWFYALSGLLHWVAKLADGLGDGIDTIVGAITGANKTPPPDQKA